MADDPPVRNRISDIAPVPSPCIGVCVLDAQQICIGCHRTIDEIIRWTSMSEEERRAIVRRVGGADHDQL
jgi:predicted Fe-S protein YdhL (DUF1289 family)